MACGPLALSAETHHPPRRIAAHLAHIHQLSDVGVVEREERGGRAHASRGVAVVAAGGEGGGGGAVEGGAVGEEGGAGDKDRIEGAVVEDLLGVVGGLVVGPGGGGGGCGGVGGEEEGGGEGEEGGGLEGGGGHGGVLESGLMDRFFCCGFFGIQLWESEKDKEALYVLANGARRRGRLGVYRAGLYRSLQPSRGRRMRHVHGGERPC